MAQQNEHAEVLAFRLGTEEFGIDIHAVRELRGYSAVTRLANAPHYLKGVVNLRGCIIPIVDLRLKLGMYDASYNATTVVIVLAVKEQQIGIVVDSVSDVINLQAEQIKPPPPSGPNFRHDYLTGIATVDERMLQLADLSMLLADVTAAAALPLAA
ncbi:chemotaxis protein CheW [Pseudoduganella sp. DS3]|uniref:Chemotaxis protein CheW n=1 Tax=Pseudoduganella guangdongensis TaxID=2692179 RepID=A0A6N9HG95_9BURK|nr:chemotaxis protein CheW [Pseudoduganella guangdongensis]MYN02307.1 chemotaxis protein CheW [Pseudoduganella guangdongensis]